MQKALLLTLILLITSTIFISIVYSQGSRPKGLINPQRVALTIAIDKNKQVCFMRQECKLKQLEAKINQRIEALTKGFGSEEEMDLTIFILVKEGSDQQIVQQVFDICKKIEGARFNVNGVDLYTPRMPTQNEIKESLAYGFSKDGRVVRLPVGKILLIRQGNKYGAIKITKSEKDFSEYEWYYQGDGTGDFTSKTAMHGTGKVFEKYREIEISPIEYQVVDIGSKLFIEFGIFSLEWNQGNWVYFPKEEDPKNQIEMTLTEAEDIQEIDITSPELEFHRKR